MDTDPATLWQETLRHLSQHVSRANYETWLAGTEGLRLDDNALIVGTRSEFVTEWLQKRLRPLIIRTLTDLGGQSLTVRFEPLRAADDDTPALQTTEEAPPSSVPRPRLRDRYTFEHFIVGPGNRLAHAAAEGCASAPGDSTIRSSSTAASASARRTCCMPSGTAS